MRHVLELRFGLTGCDPKTLEEVGEGSASRASASVSSRLARSASCASSRRTSSYI